MSKSKIIRLVLAILVLGASVVLLLWAFLPALRETRVLPIPPGGLQLPTPEAWFPLLMGRV